MVFSVLVTLVWVGAAVIVAQLIVGKIMLVFMSTESFFQPVAQAAYAALAYLLALFLVVWVPANLQVKWRIVNVDSEKLKAGRKDEVKLSRSMLGLKGLPTWTDIGLAPIGFIVALFLAAGLTAVFNMFPFFNAEEVQELGFSVYVSGMDRVLAFIALVVVAPIAEEIIFRGWLYGRLREKLSHEVSEVAGVIISSLLVSLLFGIVHLQWNVGVNVFALSLVLCGLREVTGTIYAGILTHMIKNGVAFYLRFMVGM